MEQDFILYERQPDGTYTRSGALPKGTRYAGVVSPTTVEGSRLTIKRAKDWIDVLDRGPLKLAWYKLIAQPSPHPMSDKAKEKLRALAESKEGEDAENLHVSE